MVLAKGANRKRMRMNRLSLDVTFKDRDPTTKTSDLKGADTIYC